MRRREFIKVIAASAAAWPLVAAWPLAAGAQQAERVRKIGILMPLRENDPEAQARITAFSQTLRQIGWVGGQTIAFEVRFSDGKPERLPELASDLVRVNVDVIVTQAAEPIEAVRRATTTIPIVMASVGDAVGSGFVESLAHPGGNVTGLTLIATDQSAKRLQLIKELLPAATRVAVISNANASGHRLQLKEMQLAAPKLGIVLQSLALKSADEMSGALRAAAQANAQAIITMDDPLIASARNQVIGFGLQQHLPVMGEFRFVTEAGGAISYGPSQIDMWKRAAVFVDKILKGANPADVPIERPTKFELVVNLKTAKGIGLTVPPMLLVAADEVIE